MLTGSKGEERPIYKNMFLSFSVKQLHQNGQAGEASRNDVCGGGC